MTSFSGAEASGALPQPFPFETAYQFPDVLSETMHFNGRLANVVAQLAMIDTARHAEERFWHPARIVRAVVNSKVEGQARVDLLQPAMDYAADAYTGKTTSGQYERVVKGLIEHRLLSDWVEQTYDPTTLEAQQPGRAAAAAERLHARVGNSDLLVLPLCHGGLLPAIEGAAYYNRMTGRDAAMYPIRYSRTKSFDRTPKIRPEELEHIREAAQGRTVVVYDDDTQTGRTISRTVQHLVKNGIGEGGNLVGVVNYDRRSNRRMARQGQWFENIA
jgi:phosphoribosylpyrophosphate synthetase